jgi:hypothetical protein
MEPETMVVLATYESADVAQARASSLVERGLGATIEPADPGSGGPNGASWALRVLPDDATRAREVLGLPEVSLDEADEDEELTQSVRSVLIPVLLGIVVLVVVPLVAFFVSFKLSGG